MGPDLGRQSIVAWAASATESGSGSQDAAFTPAEEKFRVEMLIGRGGMGEVHLVTDEDLSLQQSRYCQILPHAPVWQSGRRIRLLPPVSVVLRRIGIDRFVQPAVHTSISLLIARQPERCDPYVTVGADLGNRGHYCLAADSHRLRPADLNTQNLQLATPVSRQLSDATQ